MPYLIIKNQPVFLYKSRYDQIASKAINGMNAVDKVVSLIKDSPQQKERDKLIYEFLKEEYKSSPTEFYKKWVYFDIAGDEASENVWDLLMDYCNLYGYGYISDLRKEEVKIVDSYTGNSIDYPMGKTFLLNHLTKPDVWWRKYFRKNSVRVVKITIDTENVLSLKGNLKEFVINTKGFTIRCGKDVEIY